MFFETTLTAERIARHEAAGEWTGAIFSPLLRANARRSPDKVAVFDRFGETTYGDLDRIADEFAAGLLDLGIRPRDVVQVQLPNWAEFVIAVIGIERIGAVVNPVAPIFRTNEVRVMSELARPVAVVTATEFRGFELGRMHTELTAACPWVEHVIVTAGGQTGDGSPSGSSPWPTVLERGRARSDAPAEMAHLGRDPNEVCEIMFTSGTTGQPKGVLHTQNTLSAAMVGFARTVGANQAQVFHMASTLAHQTGYLYGLRAPLTAGASVVLQDAWDPVAFAGLIESHGVTISMGATPFLADLLAIDDLDRRSLGSFRVFICAGAAIPRPVLEDANRRLPCTVLPGWGMTEVGLQTTGSVDDDFERRLTDGRPYPGNEVRVVDEEGERCAAGVEGDLHTRGSLLCVGYLQGRDLTAAASSADGWLLTGDRATLDGDGYLKITGRSKDLVIRGGENVPVKEIEDVLLDHPKVSGVAVVAKTHERLGEIACAVVTTDAESLTLAELTEFLAAAEVTRQFWPEALLIVEEFPMTPSGKVQKFKLRELVDDSP